jgi:hypothetical protein
MAVTRVGGRLLGWSCRYCGIRATLYAQAPERPRTAVENPRIRLRFGRAFLASDSIVAADGLRTRPWRLTPREGRVAGAMVASIVMAAPSPALHDSSASDNEDIGEESEETGVVLIGRPCTIGH